jgi:hypothetical protein
MHIFDHINKCEQQLTTEMNRLMIANKCCHYLTSIKDHSIIALRPDFKLCKAPVHHIVIYGSKCFWLNQDENKVRMFERRILIKTYSMANQIQFKIMSAV